MQIFDLWELVHPRLKEQVESGRLTEKGIVIFCDVHPSTVKGWLKNMRPAVGEKLCRLWFLMELAGSPSPEMQKLPKLNRILSELYAFGLIDLDDVHVYCGLKPNGSGGIHATLRGQPILAPLFSAEEVEKDYRERLDAKRAEVFKEFIKTDATPIEPEAVPQAEVSPEIKPVVQQQESTVVAPPSGEAATVELPATEGASVALTLASLLGASAPLAKYLLSETATVEEREAFRELVTPEVLFEIQNTLSALSSERVRREAR